MAIAKFDKMTIPPERDRRVKLTPKEKDIIYAAYASGISKVKLCSIYDVSYSTINDVCNPDYYARKLESNKYRFKSNRKFYHREFTNDYHAYTNFERRRVKKSLMGDYNYSKERGRRIQGDTNVYRRTGDKAYPAARAGYR